jgi:two-component system sensor histidine kinase PilS (NtrC family)
MPSAVPTRPGLGASAQPEPSQGQDTREIARIWQGFMTARFTLGLVLVVLQFTLYAAGMLQTEWLLVVSLGYFASTLTTGFFGTPRRLGSTFNRPWIGLVGVDVLAFSVLQFLPGTSINYTPLFVLPILLASVLGSLQLALGTAAGVTVLLLGGTLWTQLTRDTDTAPYLVQSALSGVGYFAIALLANQLSSRLASEGLRARRSLAAANVQRQVNTLVIESMPDGVLIVDQAGGVRATNPAAELLLGARAPQQELQDLTLQAAWAPLLALTRRSLDSGLGQEQDVVIKFDGQGPRRIRVRTRLTAPEDVSGEVLCVLFLQDQRELEARMRTEKLASMGRLSTAVAHEIRNPLAAISQANALLEEELQDPRHRQLTRLVDQNAQRLAKTVDDILNASHLPLPNSQPAGATLPLNETAERVCKDWARQTGNHLRLQTSWWPQPLDVHFDADHLRRVLVNLLDNASRYASDTPGSIAVRTHAPNQQQAQLSVWSDGLPMDQSVERHLFEPFFSSESRSSGMGLYICRELCESHGAGIHYQRAPRGQEPGGADPDAAASTEGNVFTVTLERSGVHCDAAPSHSTPVAWRKIS